MGAFTGEEWRRREIMGKRRGGNGWGRGGNGIRKQVLARIFHVKPEEWGGFKCPRCIWNELSLA
jgi:hypothetical protein